LQSEEGVDVPGEENALSICAGVVGVIARGISVAISPACGCGAGDGNTVVMKPSEQSRSSLPVDDIFREVGLPDGVLNYLPARRVAAPRWSSIPMYR